jgi:hypothetical protein
MFLLPGHAVVLRKYGVVKMKINLNVSQNILEEPCNA